MGHHGPVNFEIYVMNADGSNQTNISNSPVFDAQPDWSPDGSTIVWNSTRDSLPGGVNFEIYAMNPGWHRRAAPHHQRGGGQRAAVVAERAGDLLPEQAPRSERSQPRDLHHERRRL